MSSHFAPVLRAASHQSSRRRVCLILSGLAGLSLVCLALACALGSVSLSFSELIHALPETLQGQADTLAANLLGLRLERALSGFVTGATLALAGVMMQALLRNPLADPFVLGVSGGASVGALAALLFFSLSWIVDLAAFAGAILVAVVLFGLAYQDLRDSGSKEGNAPILILTGVVVAAGCGALVTLMLTIAPDSRLRTMVFWLIGDLSGTQSRLLSWLILGLVLLYSMRRAHAINVVAMFAENAASLGVNVTAIRQILFFCAALLTASAVSGAGSIGFVGLIIPHICRFAWGADHRLLLPASALLGGSFLVLADTLARIIVAPQQLPVGVITALIGVPAFLVQLHYVRKR
jgi:iron complex transport system permease protein